MGRSAFWRHKIGLSCDILDRTKKHPQKTVGAKKKNFIGEKLVEINLQAVYMKAWGKSLHTKINCRSRNFPQWVLSLATTI